MIRKTKEELRKEYAKTSFEFALGIIKKMLSCSEVAKVLGDKSKEVEEQALEIYKQAYYAKKTSRGMMSVCAAAILVTSEKAGIKDIKIESLIYPFIFRKNQVVGAKKAVEEMLNAK